MEDRFVTNSSLQNTEDGLHHPVLRFPGIEDIAVQTLSDEAKDKDSGNICHWVGTNAGTQKLAWECGVPRLGYESYGITNAPQPSGDGYIPGTCGIHFIDYQIPDGGSYYSMALRIVDGASALIGQVGDSYAVGGEKVDATSTISVDSRLNYTLEYTRPQPRSSDDPNDAAIRFSYAGISWDTSSCGLGAFDSGARQGDCTFAC